MANTRELRRRIKSIKNTSQITKAMQMVAATKMRKAQNQALGSRPYSTTLTEVLSQLSGKVKTATHPLLLPNGSDKVGIMIMSSDKGLCGALNSNLLRLLQTHPEFNLHGNEKVVFYTIGKKGRDFIARSGKDLQADFESHEHIGFSESLKIRKFLMDAFLNKEVGTVYLLYPHFVSTLRQEPKLVKVLPISEAGMTKEGNDNEFLFEPNADDVLEFALTHLIETQIYQALLETKASEHSARMVAMKNATDNAKDLVLDLSLTYNQVRQAGVTNELLEITSAAAALE